MPDSTGGASARAGGGAVGAVGGEVLSTFTIADFLSLDVTAQGSPEVLAAGDQLDRRVRWLHVTELVNTQGLLQGGELILATGIALPQDGEAIARYVDAMADQGVAGLAIELGRRFSEVPSAMVRACARRQLPLIALRCEVPFVKMTEAAHSVILMGQRRVLKLTALAHERFTELSASDADADELVRAAGELAEGQVVFSNLMHQVLAAYSNDGSTVDLLSRWSRHPSNPASVFGTRVDTDEFTVITPVDVRGQQRGRLTLFTSAPPDPAQVMVLERAAAAIAMRLLSESDDVVLAHARRTVLTDIIAGRFGSVDAMHARAAALGHVTRDRFYLPVVVLSQAEHLGELIAKALDEAHLEGLRARLAPDRWAVLLLMRGDRPGPEERFAEILQQLCRQAGVDRPVVARGGLVADLADVRRSFTEANEVALASSAVVYGKHVKDLYTAHDVQLRGLLYLMRDDARLQAFVERSVGPLLLRDAMDGGGWVDTLAAYLRFQGNKSLAAQELGISRPTLYERLARIQRLLQLDLDDAERRTSLYAAIMLVEATGVHVPLRATTAPSPVSSSGTLTRSEARR
jgi:purine catabolism regulator